MPKKSATVRPPLEKYIEKKICDYARSVGCIVYKFTSPNQRSVPDRIIIAPGGAVGWLEIKRKGEVPTKLQAIEHEKLRKIGATVSWVDDIFNGQEFVGKLLRISMATRLAEARPVQREPKGKWMTPIVTTAAVVNKARRKGKEWKDHFSDTRVREIETMGNKSVTTTSTVWD